ncbi:MAG: YicC family protein [Neisseriaceae bacterium]|nr:YicC family protein [Neisseriaceae bacterium]
MISSMTGFAAAQHETADYAVRLDLKSVNHRYLDIQCKLPEEWRHLEMVLRNEIAAVIHHGKIECRLFVEETQTTDNQLNPNWQTIDSIVSLGQEIAQKYPHLPNLSVADVLRFHSQFNNKKQQNNEQQQQVIIELLKTALQQFKADRVREGEKLQQHLLQRLDKMQLEIKQLEEIFPAILENYHQKIQLRLKEAVENINEDRLAQEFALFMQKADVDEEFSRLKTHIDEVRRIITTDGEKSIGKRLDFLMQELNREANTLGSKAVSIESTNTSVALKVLIEQMREQVQNIE